MYYAGPYSLRKHPQAVAIMATVNQCPRCLSSPCSTHVFYCMCSYRHHIQRALEALGHCHAPVWPTFRDTWCLGGIASATASLLHLLLLLMLPASLFCWCRWPPPPPSPPPLLLLLLLTAQDCVYFRPVLEEAVVEHANLVTLPLLCHPTVTTFLLGFCCNSHPCCCRSSS